MFSEDYCSSDHFDLCHCTSPRPHPRRLLQGRFHRRGTGNKKMSSDAFIYTPLYTYTFLLFPSESSFNLDYNLPFLSADNLCLKIRIVNIDNPNTINNLPNSIHTCPVIYSITIFQRLWTQNKFGYMQLKLILKMRHTQKSFL